MKPKGTTILLVLAIGLLAFAPAVESQPAGKVYRIGILYQSTGYDPNADPTERAFIEGLREHGYIVGQNLVIEFRSAYGKPERLPELAAELVKIPVDLILVPGRRQAGAAKQATTTNLVINLKTAKTLKLTIPASVLARADEVVK